MGLNRFCFVCTQTWKHQSVETESMYFILSHLNLMCQRICTEDDFGLFCPVEEKEVMDQLGGHLASGRG